MIMTIETNGANNIYGMVDAVNKLNQLNNSSYVNSQGKDSNLASISDTVEIGQNDYTYSTYSMNDFHIKTSTTNDEDVFGYNIPNDKTSEDSEKDSSVSDENTNDEVFDNLIARLSLMNTVYIYVR